MASIYDCGTVNLSEHIINREWQLKDSEALKVKDSESLTVKDSKAVR